AAPRTRARYSLCTRRSVKARRISSQTARCLAKRTRPEVSVSSRWTAPPSRGSAEAVEQEGAWATTALARVPVSPARSGCVGHPEGFSATRSHSSSWGIRIGRSSGTGARSVGTRARTSWPGRRRCPLGAGLPSTRTAPSSMAEVARRREIPIQRARHRSRRCPASSGPATKRRSSTVRALPEEDARHLIDLGVEDLEGPGGLREGDGDDLVAAEGGHHPPLPPRDQVGGLDAES